MGHPHETLIRESKVPNQLIWAVVAICVLSFPLNFVGVDFGTPIKPFDPSATSGLPLHKVVDALHYTLTGSFSHTLLESSIGQRILAKPFRG